MNIHGLQEDLKKIAPERIVLFIGSGLVKPLGYPSWPEFLQYGVDFTKRFSPEISALMASRLQKQLYLQTANSFFDPEIPISEFVNFLREHFDKNPEIPSLYENLFSCPLTAFITTNFDRSIEQAQAHKKKPSETFSDATRFGHFNSRFSVYATSGELRTKNGLILKMHGDVSHPDEITLSSTQFGKLKQNEQYLLLYRRLLSEQVIIYLGYSGNDPNFEWHCSTLIEVCGIPHTTSYFVHPTESQPPVEISKANLVDVAYSAAEGHRELNEFLMWFATHYSSTQSLTIAPEIQPISDERKNALAFLCAGLSENTHSSSYECAVTSMIAGAIHSIGSSRDREGIIKAMARLYRLSWTDAERLLEYANKQNVDKAVENIDRSKARLAGLLKTLKDGVSKRSIAFGKPFKKSDKTFEKIVSDTIVGSMEKAGYGLALSLVDSEAPEASLVDKAIRNTVKDMRIEGIGPLDKEILISAFADLFTRPTKEEEIAITTLAQASVAGALATTFSGGLNKLLTLMPTQAYLDSNVAIPLVIKDHPRSLQYNELTVSLSKLHCDIFLLDVFLDEMVNHCRLAHAELQMAKIKNLADAKSYAEFHGSHGINAFIAAYVLGAQKGEKFETYLKRIFKTSNPNMGVFRREIEKLGVEITDTRHVDKSPRTELAIHIADEKSRLMRMRAQILAENEALQILWLHKQPKENIVWFITEDAILRRILRALPKVKFSNDPPSRGVMPAFGAQLVLGSILDRPGIQAGFAQLLWNPAYLEQVDTMLSSVLKKFAGRMKELLKLNILELRDMADQIIQKEAVRSEKDAMHRRAHEYMSGEPQIVESILRQLGERD